MEKFVPNEDCLYKYVSFETGLKILESETIRYSNPKTFNDPYDSDMPIKFKQPIQNAKEYILKALWGIKNDKTANIPEKFNVDRAIKQIQDNNAPIIIDMETQIGNILLSLKKNMRVLSLSRVNDNLLMWGHYANCHNGMVIGFNRKSTFLENVHNVYYRDDICELDGEIIKDPLLKNTKSIEELNKLVLTKSSDWKYEQECRCLIDVKREYKDIIKRYGNGSTKLIHELETQNDYINVPFPKESICNIYLGIKVNIIDENTIINLIKNKYPQVNLYKASLSKTKFKINFNKITI